ncbi:2Fe-2S iron-sulfur cluster-binding protein [Gordonia otitidis]|uniref:2Fe-2S iron-sulfur cluster-binding protein n=1 Tax=Gordonia otitidis TaxID=249058 RepID=UPI001D14D3A1|nr:2Fe-2S iron-sulfur cluster-binding protein [Gordonia otitidis]UEA58020.1 2Fe-2S iron-sulfur cluster-binding protein [Gordonia otitidis]
MPKIIYRSSDGTENYVDASVGSSVMQAAISAGIDGIVAECGGNAMCATCHVFVDAESPADFPEMAADEDEMLDCAVTEREPNSRLSCQLFVTADHDGLVVDLPAAQ